MLKAIKTLIVFSFSATTIGQQLDTIYKNQIKLSVFRLVDISNPGIELNYERYHSKKFSSELSAAYMGNIVRSENFKGFRIGFEEKRFLKRPTQVRTYISTQIVYNNSALKNVDNFGYDTSTNTQINVPFTIVKKTAAFNVKLGFEYALGRIEFDYFFGIGIKYREFKHVDRKYPFVGPKHWNIYDPIMSERHSWNLNLPSTFKIGYIF
jgi:hypothetical protein